MTQKLEFITNFVNEFHNLQGATIAERKRNQHTFLNNASSLRHNPALLDAVLAQLQPQTYLEKRFFIDFLIYFHKYRELANEVFVKENHIAIKQILSQKWFFEQTLSESGAVFITDIVSTLSYNLTFKVLRKIAPLLNHEQGNAVFDSLLKIYGISLAQCVLTSCSREKIVAVLQNHHVVLRQQQLKSLFDKDSRLIYTYLDEREKHEGDRKFMDFHPIFHYIAKQNLNIFQDLCQKYDFKIKLGKRITKKFVTLKRVDVLTRPELYVKNLHPRCLIKVLGSDFNDVYLKLFPKKIEDSPNSECARLLKHYPKQGQYNLMISTYNQVFARKLEERPHLIDEYLLEIIPDSEEREKFAKLKNDDSDSHLRYYSPAHCFQIIKEKINFARYPYERSNYVAILVQSCLIDNNYNALLQVAKFVTERFKNDNAEVEQKFVQVLLWQKCDFNKLNEEHWHEIKKIMARPDLYIYDYSVVEIFYKYIEFLTKLKRPIETEIVDFHGKREFAADHVAFIQQPHVQKTFLVTFIEVVPKVATTNLESLDCELLAACHKYNLQHPKNPIQVLQYPRLLQSVRSVLANKNKNEEALSSALEILLCLKETTQELEKLREDEFWRHVQFATPSIMRWFLKYKPEIVQRNLNTFLSFAIKNDELVKDTKFWSSLKYYSHLNIDTESVQFLSRDLTPLKSRILSYVSPETDFLALVATCKPETFTIDGTNAQFNTQMALLHSVKNINSPREALLLLLQFCNDDYVPFCVGPVYSMIFNVPKNQLEPLIAEMKRTMTKHAYYFISVMCSKDVAIDNLRVCQVDQSVRISFKYFLRDSCDETWELFTTKLSTVKNVGLATLKLLARTKVPRKYRIQYFEKIWRILQENDSSYKNLLLTNLSIETLSGLNYDFLQELLQSELFHEDKIDKVFSTYLIASSEVQKNMTIVTTGLEKYHQRRKVSSTQFSLKRVYNLIATLFATYMEKCENNENLIDGLLTLLQQMFGLIHIFEPYVTLSLMKCKTQTPCNFASSVVILHNNLIAKHGETITEIFGHVVKKLISHFFKSNPQIYEFYYYLLVHQKSTADTILVIKLLPSDSEPEDVESSRYYDEIIQQMENLNVLSVQLHLNLYFKYRKMVQDVSYYERINHFAINTSSWLCPGARRKIGYTYY